MVPVLSFLAGLSVALSARQQIRRGTLFWREPYFLGLIFFVVLVLLPLCAFFFWRYPYWSTLYWFPAADASLGMAAVVLAGSLAAAVLGYLLGHLLCRRGQERILGVLAAASLVGLVLFFVLAGDRFVRLAQDADWRHAPSIFSTELGMTFAFVIPVVAGGWIFLLVLFAMEGKRILRARIGTVYGDASFPSLDRQTPVIPGAIGSREVAVSPAGGVSALSVSTAAGENSAENFSRENPAAVGEE